MRKRQVWRYYCDHCGKGGCSKHHMEQHERSCTLNPERECRMCAADPGAGAVQHAMPELIEAIGSGDEAGMKRIRDVTGGDRDEGCPACILAAIRQSGLGYKPGESRRPKDEYDCPADRIAADEFKFKDECASFWSDVNDGRAAEGSWR